MTERVYNFNPGPAVLPVEVLESVRDNILSFKDTGIGLLEMSHRAAAFDGVINETTALFKELLGIGDEFEVLYTTGGASNQFSMVPMNLLSEGKVGNYILTGVWAEKAYKEAAKFGATHAAASSKENSYKNIPTEIKLSDNAAYCHFTSNNTIYGTEFSTEPEVGNVPLICDASSDFLHKPLDMKKYAAIYAGAQKNIGPAGVSVMIIRKELIEASKATAELPVMMSYKTYSESKSLYNTPPVFAIFVIHEVLEWVKAHGGLEAAQKRNQEKARIIYEAIDKTDFYRGHAEPASRSEMNITFRLPSEDLEKKFVSEATAKGLAGLKGHRSVGGLRASVYNAFPLEGAKALAEFMAEFEKNNG